MRRWRGYQRKLKKMHPIYGHTERKALHREYDEQVKPRPECPVKKWETKSSWERKNSPVGKYKLLLQALKDAQDELAEFMKQHGSAKIAEIEKKAEELREWDSAMKEWEDERDRWAQEVFHQRVLEDDIRHVAKTGMCCGENKYGRVRGCSRKATQGHFCKQHQRMAPDWRKK